MQSRNYISRKENERKRREMFDDGLDKFKAKDLEGVRKSLFCTHAVPFLLQHPYCESTLVSKTACPAAELTLLVPNYDCICSLCHCQELCSPL